MSNEPLRETPWKHRGYLIHPPAEAHRPWEYVHKDWAMVGDPRWGTCDSFEQCQEQIDERIHEGIDS